MPTPTLPLLHQLLTALHIPVLPPSLSATPPSLLLVILESVTRSRLPLRHPIRLCSTAEDELAVVKCILGSLADDILGIDLSIVDPAKVVLGSEEEMAVVIMALVVVAKRNGLRIKLPSSTPPPFTAHGGEDQDEHQDILDEEDDDYMGTTLAELPAPILPDISYSYSALTTSSPIRSPMTDGDVFDSTYALANTWTEALPGGQSCPLDIQIDSAVARKPSSTYEQKATSDISFLSSGGPNENAPKFSSFVNDNSCEGVLRIDEDEGMFTSMSSVGTASSGKTVLHQMLEEFGLDPYS